MNITIVKRWLAGFSLIISFVIPSEAATLSVVKQKDKFGYADESGNVVIKPVYSVAYPFEDDKAKVQKGDKWGYIDRDGKPVIKLEYDNIEAFENGIALVKKNNKYGYIREDGTFYIKPEYNYIGSINDDGYVWVGKGKSLKDALIGLYKEDKLIVPVMYKSVGFYVPTDSIDYTNGMPIEYPNGKPANNEIKGNLNTLSSSQHPYIWASDALLRTSIFDTDGKILIKSLSGCVGMPKDGYALNKKYKMVKKQPALESNYYALDGKNTKLLKKNVEQILDETHPLYMCTPFEEGLAICGNNTGAHLINLQGEQVGEVCNNIVRTLTNEYIYTHDDKYGLLSQDGKEAVPGIYAGMFLASDTQGVYAAKNDDGKWGYITNSGEIILPFKYDGAGAFIGSHAFIREGEYCGVVDNSGKCVVRNKWANIIACNKAGDDVIWVQSPETNKWSAHKLSNDKPAFKLEVDGAESFDDDGRALITIDDKIGAVDTSGKILLPVRFATRELANAALAYLTENGRTEMRDIEAYRFNLYHHPDIKKYKLHETIETEMWDF
ncbi:MAG: WG repeat-containing protein [Muribaculaceae bacterium]|nr:WG repeat-containing protein [Muribaculaceae bacterium]